MAEEDPTMSRQAREPSSQPAPSNTESILPISTLRELSDELYVTKREPQLEYLHNFFNENGDFPRILIDERNPLSHVFWTKWSSGGYTNRPSNLYDNILRYIEANASTLFSIPLFIKIVEDDIFYLILII
jgi:hypothetical protein